MLTVKIRRNENPERAVSRLKNLMMKEGVLNDLKRKRYHQKPSLKRRLKKENAARQRVKDLHKDIRAAQRAEENFLKETNFSSYIAVGMWHHYLNFNNKSFLKDYWPVLDSAIEFTLSWDNVFSSNRSTNTGLYYELWW